MILKKTYSMCNMEVYVHSDIPYFTQNEITKLSHEQIVTTKQSMCTHLHCTQCYRTRTKHDCLSLSAFNYYKNI